ncbi:MAG: benzoate-CoA ligase family protein [Gemmatimonadetes bacterium]|nr:benzoate-CoA ligase family protein [Gemmatimonadota bacterium]
MSEPLADGSTAVASAVPFEPPAIFNIARYFLEDRLREGRGERRAVLTSDGSLTYREVDALANQFGNLLLRADVRPEERVLIALSDGPEFAAALFGTLKIGAVAVMLNPHLKPDEIEYFFRYTRGAALFVSADRAPFFREVIRRIDREDGDADAEWGEGIRAPRETFVVGSPGFAERLEIIPEDLRAFPTHRDDPAIWLFSGGTTGRPKAVVQTHASFANTTECYGKGVLAFDEDDITLSVPKLFFGYATGSNLLFPFAVGATAALFPERCTPETLFDKIEAFRPTILINVPTMVNQMLAAPDAATRDLSSLRLATSAGEALPVELHRRWDATYGVDLLDGLGTAEMWHVFLSNRPGDVRLGTLGRAVPGFEVRVCDDEGAELPIDEVGWLWVRGRSRAIAYWQQAEKSSRAFRGEWYVSGDMVVRDAEGVFTYCGRGDDMLKVKGRWLSPKEVENCLLRHPSVQEVAVIGVANDDGLIEPIAWVIPTGAGTAGLEQTLADYVADEIGSYKAPARVTLVAELPRTHLGKVDRGELRARSTRA